MSIGNTTKLIHTTESLCPFCMLTVDSQVVERNGMVFLEKMCPEHGALTLNIWPDAAHYQWMNAFRLPPTPPQVFTSEKSVCPTSCGLCIAHKRQPTLVEIEVTQRCNLRCPVCFVAAGQAPADPDLDRIEQMYSSIRQQTGEQTSIQLTGGEPTVRSDLHEIIRTGRGMGFSAIEINTNGLVIAQNPAYLEGLARAGLTGIYLQFDGLTGDAYKQIRGIDLLNEKMQAIENCRQMGVQVVLAMTVIWGVNHDQIGNVLDFALSNTDTIAGLALQPAFTSGRFDLPSKKRLNMGDVIFMLAEQSDGLIEPYDLWPLGCSHPLCSSATFIINDRNTYKPITRLITSEEYAANFSPDSPQGSVFADLAVRKFPHFHHGLSIVVMNYMDALTLDLKRVQECSMDVVMEDGRLIPFCAYQLTDVSHQRLYPTWGRQVEGTNG